jgi:cytochrome P450
MSDTTDTDLLFTPLAPGFTDDPYPAYAYLRENLPVYKHPFDFWILTRYADVSAILRSEHSADPHKLADGSLVRLQFDQLREQSRPSYGLSMLDRDPPDHTRLRSLVTKVFTPRSVAALEPEITALVDTALDAMADAGEVDLVDALAFPLPFTVISRMLGIPATDAARIRELSGLLVRTLEVITDPDVYRAVQEAGDEMDALIRDLIAWKRTAPAADLLSALIAAEQDGDRLTDDELVAQVVLLYVAGHETTVNLIANGTVALLAAPDQLAALRTDPGLAANAVEELLRFDSPVQQSRRITIAPYTVGDTEIPAGSFIIACLASANRDEAFFGSDAGRLRLDRPTARHHVSFGAGPHHCLGAALARLEGRVALERLVGRFPELGAAGEVEWNGRVNLRGPARVPVRVR